MNFRPTLAAGLLLVLSGCATYEQSGYGPGGYYRGSPEVQYRYPPGYYDRAYGYPSYGYPYYSSPYSWGSYGYPVYRGGGYVPPPPPPRRRPPPNLRSRPDDNFRPPATGSRPNPPARAPVAPRPSRPEGKTTSPWRSMGKLKRAGD